MVHELLLPQLSMGMSEGTIVEWAAEEGAYVKKETPLLSVETEKVVTEIPAPYSGYLHIDVPAGQTVPIETRIARFVETADECKTMRGAGQPPTEVVVSASANSDDDTPHPANSTGRIAVSGLARKVAQDMSVPLQGLTGTGPGGRVVRRDVLAAAIPQTGAAMLGAAAGGGSMPAQRVVTRIPLTGMRGTIARRMVEAKTVAAPTYVFFEIDVTGLIAIRKAYLARESELKTRISLTTLYVRALSLALTAVPICNATVSGGEIAVWDDVNIGIAVALPGQHEVDSGIIVPVVHQANRKSLLPLDRELKDLIAKARARELSADALQDATATLSSTAGFFPDGWMVSAPILNLPQVISFQPGTIVRKPVVRDDQIVARDILPCALTFDHRALDGEPAGRLAKKIAELLSTPELMLL